MAIFSYAYHKDISKRVNIDAREKFFLEFFYYLTDSTFDVSVSPFTLFFINKNPTP
jgi:hypothetical protein